MKKHRLKLLIAAIAAIAAFAPTAQAQTVPQSLLGEALLAGGEAGGVGSFDVSPCNPDGSFSFTASGVAVGPYPGTFTESGTVTPLATPLPDGTSLASFEATFTIDSPTTGTTITGTKTMRVVTAPEGRAEAVCLNIPNVSQTQVIAFVTYDATIVSPLGTFQDTGNSTVDAERVFVNGEDLANDFKESFTLSRGVVPVGSGCEDDEDDDGSDDEQESLYGTLTGNRDSDGDGTTDGNEDSDDDGDDDEDEDDDSDDCEPDSDEDGTDDEDEDDDDDDQPAPPAQNASPVTAEIMQGPAPEWTQTNCNNLTQSATVHYTSSGTATGTYPGTYTLGPSLGDPSSPVLRPVTGFTAEFTIVSGTTTIEGTKTLAFRPEIQGDAACVAGDVSSFSAPGEACTYEAVIHTPTGSFRDRGQCFVGISSQGPFPPDDTFQGEFLENLASDLTETEPVCTSDDDDDDDQCDDDDDEDDEDDD